MDPIVTEYTNTIFKLPGGTEENDLPVEKNVDSHGRDVLVSTWKLSDVELAALQESGKIDLIIWGKDHPPVALAIHEQEEDDGDSY